MKQTDLIEFIVYHIECTNCPVYVQCQRDKPKTCAEMITKLFQACDNATNQAVKNHVALIRRTYKKMLREKDSERRRSVRLELNEQKRKLREVKEYVK